MEVEGKMVWWMMVFRMESGRPSSLKGAWDISDEMNQLFPDYKFTPIEDFLTEVWSGKP